MTDLERYALNYRGDSSLNESIEALVSNLERVTAERDELNSTLAAELGDVQGAPSARWTCDGRTWYAARSDGGMDKIEHYANLNGDGTVKHARAWIDVDRFGWEKDCGRFKMARAAMKAADAEQGKA